jgi:peptide/nickel transport system permease protein
MFLGTDRQGRSISLRAFYSIKVAIQIGLVTALISVAFGSLLGAAAAYVGGWVDHLVIWLYSTFQSIPNLVLLVLLAYMFTGTQLDGTLVPVYVAFCMTFWIGPCRVIRGETLKIKELEYVQAAVSIGFSRLYILIKHVLPNTAHLMLINFSLLFIGAIKSEVILSFLNLGVKKGPSWGIMISHSKQEVINGFFWQIGTATALMFVLVLAFNILTDSLQDIFDPKHAG